MAPDGAVVGGMCHSFLLFFQMFLEILYVCTYIHTNVYIYRQVYNKEECTYFKSNLHPTAVKIEFPYGTMLILCFGCNTAKCSRLCTLKGSSWFIPAHKTEEMSLPVPLLWQEAPAWTHMKCHTAHSQQSKTHCSGVLGTCAGRKPQACGSARQGSSALASKEAGAQNPKVPCEFCGHAME